MSGSYSFELTGPPTASTGLGAPTDQLIDPVTLDYVRTSNGRWAETADSRTIVLIQLDTELGASPFFPADGTRIKAMLRAGEPLTLDQVQADMLRATKPLQLEGILSGLVVDVRDSNGEPLFDTAGHPLVIAHWRDLVGGSPIDLVLQIPGDS